jgi:hypothetical protein
MCVITRGGTLRDVLWDRAGRAGRQSSLPLWPNGRDDRFLLLTVTLSLAIVVLSAVRRRSATSASLALLALCAVPAGVQRTDTTHLLYVALLSVPLIPVAVRSLLPAVSGVTRMLPTVLGVAALVLGTGSVTVNPWLHDVAGRGPGAEVVRHDGRELRVTPAQARGLEGLLPELDRVAAPGARLFVYDSNLTRPAITDLAVYYLSPRLDQTAHTIDVTPGVSNAPGAPLAKDIAQADVVVLVLVPEDVRNELFPHARDGSPEPSRALHERFRLAVQIEYYELWIRRDR